MSWYFPQNYSWGFVHLPLITNITGAQEIEDNSHSKSITPSESEEMDHSEDSNANSGHDGEVDKEDNVLPLTETSSIGNSELFNADPLLLYGTICLNIPLCQHN